MNQFYMRSIFVALLALMTTGIYAQLNVSFVGQLTYTVETSDIWGYADQTGEEYALVGLEDGFSIVDISTDPASPAELFFIPGMISTWRDIKTWSTYAYVTNETGGGLLVVDMTNLPDSIEYQELTFGGQLNTAHNVFIDENGFAYLLGTDNPGATIFLDLNSDPYNPAWIGNYNTNYVHDAFVRNDTMWSAEINVGVFSAVNVASKSFPSVMESQSTPSNFTHNVWLSDDGNTLFTTDEQPNAFIASYDVSDLNNITELDRYQSSPGQNVIPHNTFVRGNFLITSYYRDGVVVNDVTHPDNIIEVGNYDTSPLSGQGFNGCWGVYPYLPSGNIIATDIEEGLFVLAPTYVQACYLEGVVTDSSTGTMIQGADIEIVATSVQEVSGLMGEYKTGLANGGMYDVSFSKAGYKTKVISGVVLSNGVITIQDAQLAPLPSFAFTINVVDQETLNPIPDAIASVKNSQFNFDETGNASGTIGIGAFFEGSYEIIVGKWGYRTNLISNQAIDASANTITVALASGYYDDFALDFSWASSGNASSGFWERGEPDGTTFGGSQSNPDFDVADDISDQCFVTGNAGGGAGTDDIDDGFVELSSPVFDISGYGNPFINYSRWFQNGGGFGGPANDSMIISISNGIDDIDVEVLTINNTITGQWVYHEFRIFDYLAPTSSMQVTIRAVDSDPGHLVEAAFDKFQVVDSAEATAIQHVAVEAGTNFSFYPNPATEEIKISIQTNQGEWYKLELIDILGNRIDMIQTASIAQGVENVSYDVGNLVDGIYFLQLILNDKKVVKKLVIAN